MGLLLQLGPPLPKIACISVSVQFQRQKLHENRGTDKFSGQVFGAGDFDLILLFQYSPMALPL